MTSLRKRRWLWLLAAAVFFGAGAWLMSYGRPPVRRSVRQVSFPRGMDARAHERLERRQTLPRFTAGEPRPARDEAEPKTELGDPVIAAMPARIERAAVVVEANALRHSPVGQMVVDCMLRESGGHLDEARQRLGFDFLEDLDRVTVIDDTYLLSGFFEGANWSQMFPGATATELGSKTTLWRTEGEPAMAVWNDQMVIAGKTEAEVMAVLDRLEGRAPRSLPPVMGENDSYGEIYGVVAPAAMAEVLRETHPQIADRLATAVERLALHLDASSDVGLVFDASGKNAQAGDLGRMIGGALTVGQLTARARQDDGLLAELLEHARVVPSEDGQSFRTELGLPLAFFEDLLRDCRFFRGSRQESDGGPTNARQ